MKYLQLGKNRLLLFLKHINNATMPGVYDWYVDEKDVLNILLNVNGVNYIYREYASSVDEVVKTYLTSTTMVLGYYEQEEEYGFQQTNYVDLDLLGDKNAY